MELLAAGEDHKALRGIAKSLINAATAGDVQAAKEIRDTLDGKPAQSVEMSGGLAISHEEALGELE